MLSSLGGSTLAKPVVFPELIMDDSTEERPSLSGERVPLASPTRVVEPTSVVPRRETLQLPVRVTSTIAEARASSTRRLYTF